MRSAAGRSQQRDGTQSCALVRVGPKKQGKSRHGTAAEQERKQSFSAVQQAMESAVSGQESMGSVPGSGSGSASESAPGVSRCFCGCDPAGEWQGWWSYDFVYPVSLDGNGQVIYLCPFCIVGGWSQSRYTGDDWWETVGIVGVSDQVDEQMAEWYRVLTSEREGFRKGIRVRDSWR